MKLDFSETKDNKIAEESDKADLTITAAKEAKSQNGIAMLVLDMKDANDGFVRDNICLEGAGAFKAKNLIKALGMDEETFAGTEPADLVGTQVTAKIEVEDYEGEPRARVKKYIAA